MSHSKNKISAINIAEYYINCANKSKEIITNKKLQKLLYYSQSWFLALKKKPLFEEQFEAWVHGPAIKSLYGEYKTFGFNPIRKKANKELIEKIPSEIIPFLDNIQSIYGSLDADYLEMLTHSEKPWQEARKGLQSHESSGNIISTEIMRDYYKEKLEQTK